MHIKINVLLIPGTTTPIDIKKPDIINDIIEIFSIPFPKLIFPSKTTNKYPIIKEIIANSK